MKFSEEEVYLLGTAIALIVSALIWIPFSKRQLRWFWSHKSNNSFNDIVPVSVFVCLVSGILFYYVVRKFLCYPSVIWCSIIGTLLECIAFYIYLKPVNRHYMEANLQSFNADEVSSIRGKGGFMVYFVMVGILLLNSNFCMGGIAFTRWMMPDVVEIKNGSKRAWYGYKVNEYYGLPFERGMHPGGSYIHNLSNDTVYRLVINYGYPGEELYNFYSVQGKYAPGSFSRLPSRTPHVMDTIAPIMPPSHGRNGRYRTQRIYLTDFEHMWDFKMVKMRKFGLLRNKQVDSIKEDRNHLIRESHEMYRAYKQIDSLPYSRLRPIPERISNISHE
ncbi:MAG: hypothetical protein K2K45_03385 [Muribaculaceae bacterium]|nr:hypothetical protein [Muribaculaceae bacterium]